jgi:hypothetical protein
MSRDHQRSRCYAWEDRYIHSRDTSLIHFAQAQSVVDYVWTKAGLTYPPKIRQLAKNATRTAAKAGRIWIKVPASGIKTTVLLHEIAHSLTCAAEDQCHYHHGPRFVGVLMKLLCEHIPIFGIHELMRTAQAEGIDFNFDGPIHTPLEDRF